MSSNVEQIKERLNIVDVISSYIKVEKAGINFKARCPFHNEKTPSFLISPNRQTFYCFGCGEKGDMFSFVEKFEGLDFKGALETLANKAGVELKNFKSEERPEEKDRLFEIMEEATKFFESQLSKNDAILKYLKKRELSEESISKWRLGFALDGWRNLHDYLLQKKFTVEEMLLVGLIKKAAGTGSTEETNSNRATDKYYDTFRNRVMFPICDSAGRVIAFSGRALKEDEKTPKYLNSPETKLFYKSEVLYGFNVAKNHIRKQDYTVLVEGQVDLIMSHQAGVLNTVASSGTALTELHLKKIQKLSNRAIIAYDSDASGEKASIRASELALSLGMETKIATLEKGKDPADTIKENPENWKSALKNSEHFLDFALNKAINENQGKNLTKEILKSVLPLVSLLKSEIEKSQFIKKIASKIRVPEEAVWNDLKKVDRKEILEEWHTLPQASNLERMMVAIIFLEEVSAKGPKKIKEKWQEIVGESKAKEILKNYEKEKEALIFEAEKYITDIDKESPEILKRIELQELKKELRETALSLDKDNSPGEEKKIKSHFEKIQKRIQEINK